MEDVASKGAASSVQAAMVEAQMKSVSDKVEKLAHENPPDPDDIKAASSELRRVNTLIDLVT